MKNIKRSVVVRFCRKVASRVDAFFGGARAAGAGARPGAGRASGGRITGCPPDGHNARADCISVPRSGRPGVRQGGAGGHAQWKDSKRRCHIRERRGAPPPTTCRVRALDTTSGRRVSTQLFARGGLNSRPRGYEAQPNPLTYDINAKHLMIAAVVERLCALCAVCARCVTANLQQIVTAPARPGAADRRSAGPSAGRRRRAPP